MVMPMNLSPEFQKVLRGYKVEEVDEFVGQISAAYEQIRRDLFAAKEENDKLKKQLDYFQALESSLNKALVAAQQKADEIVNTAQDEVNRSLVESRDRLENINTEIAQILAGAAEKAKQIEDDANRKSEEVLIRIREQVAAETSKNSETGHKVEKARQELVQTIRTFLNELEATSSDQDSTGGNSFGTLNW